MDVKRRAGMPAGGGDRRREILAAAAGVFAAKGFRGATTAEIARQAGIAEGTIFRYFPTKKDLLFGLFESLALEPLARLSQEVAGEGNEDAVRQLIQSRFSFIREHGELVRLLVYEGQFQEELRQGLAERVMEPAARVVEGFVRDRMAAGDFRDDLDPRLVTRLLTGFIWSLVITAPMRNLQEEDDEPFLSTVVEVFLRGVQRTSSERG